jgi:outer membrane protein TolC
MQAGHAINGQTEKSKTNIDTKSYEEVLARVIAVYPTLQSAIIQVQRSTLELDRIYATLGWNATADTNFNHDLAGFGTPADTITARGALTRKLESGDRITLDASYVRTDNEVVFINTLPNPSNDSAINLSYRKPFQKGAGNIEYHSSEQAARAQIAAQQAEEFNVRDTLAKQVALLYFGLATIEADHANTSAGVDRLRRLHEFVIRNKKLGISDEKDLLQSQARLDRKLAVLTKLETARNQSLFNLNRLMNIPATTKYSSRIDYSKKEIPARDILHKQVFNYSPALNIAYASKQTAESNIEVQRNNKKNTLDVIVSVGARAKAGPTKETDINETDLAGKVALEYRAYLDKSGLRAALQQALLNKDIADNQIRQLDIDLNNEIDRLLGLIHDQTRSIDSNSRLKQAEQKKFDEAVSRYRTGRTTTADLINFEEDLSVAELALANSRVELVSSFNELARLRGTIWQGL